MERRLDIEDRDDEIIVVGSGIAGLVTALSLAPLPVRLMTKTPALAGGSSYLAKGGIAAALGEGDSPDQHAADTLAAGAGLSDPERARGLAEYGVRYLRTLIDEGVPFDRAVDGSLALAREAAHGRARVVHAGGDATGQVLISSLVDRIVASPSVHVSCNTFAIDLVVSEGKVAGLLAVNPDNGLVFHRATRLILATGGIGMTWWHTSNPAEATGDGLAMAARAGASLADLEFVQFHPTALAVDVEQGGASLPLLTEALRGAGALLLDVAGKRFMLAESPAAELATRDIVARAIHQRTSRGDKVFLDLRPVVANGQADKFPQAFEAGRAAGFDPACEPLPVIPAAHYHMGGVEVDAVGRTSIAGLWACGEVATTGVHGANRLASNSLLEGLVYARQVADDVAAYGGSKAAYSGPVPSPLPALSKDLSDVAVETMHATLRKTMTEHVGIARTKTGMESALATLAMLDKRLRGSTGGNEGTEPSFDRLVRICELRNGLSVAQLVAMAALQREESRGAHYRDDYPLPRREWQHRQRMTLQNLAALFG